MSTTTDLRFAEHLFGFVLVANLGDGKRRVMSRMKSYKAAKAKLDWYTKNAPGSTTEHAVTLHAIAAGVKVHPQMEWIDAEHGPCLERTSG